MAFVQDKHGDKMNDFTMVLRVKLEAGNLGRGSHTSSQLVRKRGKKRAQSKRSMACGLKLRTPHTSVSGVTDWKVVGQPVRYASFD